MPSDRETSELISQSLSGLLPQNRQREMDAHMQSSSDSRSFERLSRLIQDSVSDIAQKSANGDPDVGPGLTDDAKSRLKDSVRSEQLRRSQIGNTLLVGDPTGSTANPSGRPSASPESPDGIGARSLASRFSIQRKLGSGALGTVWLARDEKLKRYVALKEMNQDVMEYPRAWQRFKREAEITGYLEHPNVVPAYQYGDDGESGKPFYTMRFVGKRTLAVAIDETHERVVAGEDTAMDFHKLLTAFVGVCQAIAYAHSRGVIHRDLKPENVALDNFGQVIVLDWGLARLLDDFEGGALLSGDTAMSDSDFEQTLAGEVIGTPLYMAPEQAAGDQTKVDKRSDIYGLGSILFSILTGTAAHAESSVEDGEQVSVGRLLQKIAADPSPDPDDFVDNIPGGLAKICRRAMHFRPHSRYQTAAELADAVEQWIAGRSERRQQYSNMQAEGRVLRTSLAGFLRVHERITRFMSTLPPIQEIIDSLRETEQSDLGTWKERLTMIYKGLMQTGHDLCAVTFSQVNGDGFKELVRIERQRGDHATVRSVPASRLESGELTPCLQAVMDGHPGDVRTSLMTRCSSVSKDIQIGYLGAAVPVFDERTEEPFGMVMIEASLRQLIEGFIQDHLRTSHRIFVLDNDCRVLMQLSRDGVERGDCDGKQMSSVCSRWQKVFPVLKAQGEYIDDQNHSVYATRVDLIPGQSSLAIVLMADVV